MEEVATARADSIIVVKALLELRLVRAIRIVSVRADTMALSTAMVRGAASTATVRAVDSTAMVRVVASTATVRAEGSTAMVRAADSAVFQDLHLAETEVVDLFLLHLQFLQRQLLQRSSSRARSRYTITAKTKKKCSMKKNFIRTRKRILLQQVQSQKRLRSWKQSQFLILQRR